MNLLTLLALIPLTFTTPDTDSLGGPLVSGEVELEVAHALDGQPETVVPVDGTFLAGQLVAYNLDLPADGLPRRVWVYSRQPGSLARSARSNAVVAMAWQSAADTLIFSAAGRDWDFDAGRPGVEWKYSAGKKVTFSYRGQAEPVEAMVGAPALLMNVRQLATWEPVHADLCRLYQGWARAGAWVRDCELEGFFFGAPRWR